MNLTDSLTTALPSLPPPEPTGGGWTMPKNAWIFIVVFVSILALLAVIALVRFFLTRHSINKRRFHHSKVIARDSLEKRVISSPTSIEKSKMTPTKTPPPVDMSPPEVIITPPTPNPGEEERAKKRTYSLEDY
ncbi:hypothetical protein PMAYCL1PPCAC_32511 [Pristionchus mayeri]|uniref:Uncharacterized protein n=1 Tax=Pristionchus mayeri TaxID=1317129 RepID=A0AAN5DEW7_9BILA|nr:hypothetical protein PMAYCL1PPCAC_32511 [Pristionchus mayeri]